MAKTMTMYHHQIQMKGEEFYRIRKERNPSKEFTRSRTQRPTPMWSGSEY